MNSDSFPRFSGMNFVSDNAYPFEESRAYLGIGEGVRTVELVRVKDNKMIFIEAKSTIANPENKQGAYLRETDLICDKFIHSLNILSAVKIGVIEDSLPSAFNAVNRVSLLFVLVLRNHRPEWCRPIKRTFEQLLPAYIKKIWRPAVIVINYDEAKKYGFIV
jgi:hypothetical protein